MPDESMPASLEAEKSILGACLLDENNFLEAAEVCRDEFFHTESHRRLFSIFREMGNKGIPLDIITVTDELEKRKWLARVGGVAYVASLTDGVVRRPSIANYTRILREKWALRGIIEASRTAIAAAQGLVDPAPILNELESRILEMRGNVHQAKPLKEISQRVIQKIEELRNFKGNTLGRPSGFTPIDVVTSGIRDDELWVVGARPNVGKTPFGFKAALDNSLQGTPVLIFSLEMSELQAGFRLFAHAGVTSARKLRDPRRIGSNEEMVAVIERAASFAPAPIWIDDDPLLSIQDLRARAKYAHFKHGIGLIVVDYVQLVRADGKDPYTRVSNVSTGLRELVRELKIPIVALSQLNRNAKNPENPPSLGDLRESGVIEQDANVVILIHRPPADVGDGASSWERLKMSKEGAFIYAKVREGEPGEHEKFTFNEVSLTFDPLQGRAMYG